MFVIVIVTGIAATVVAIVISIIIVSIVIVMVIVIIIVSSVIVNVRCYLLFASDFVLVLLFYCCFVSVRLIIIMLALY